MNDEQEGYIADGRRCLLVQALAGCGKSSAILERARRSPNSRFLILAFNRSAADGMRLQAADLRNADIRTIHSFAWDWLSRHGVDVSKRFAREFEGDQTEEGQFLFSVFTDWCRSPYETTERYLEDDPKPLRRAAEAGMNEMVLAEGLARLEEDAEDPGGKIPYTDDVYLKMAGREIARTDLSRRRRNDGYDEIILDEAQDANACALDMLVRQKHAGISLIGDPCQRIYTWNGCVDAFSLPVVAEWPSHAFTLSYRCPESVVRLVRPWLSMIGGSSFAGLRGIDGGKRRKAFLARTRMGVAKRLLMLDGEGIPPEEIELFGGMPDMSSLFMAAHMGPEELEAAARMAVRIGRPDLRHACAYVKARGASKILEFEKLWERNGERYGKDGRYVVTTTHKAKGAEFSLVEVEGDFPKPQSLFGKRDVEDLRLLYVAMTRASEGVAAESAEAYSLSLDMQEKLLYRLETGKLAFLDGEEDVTDRVHEGLHKNFSRPSPDMERKHAAL